MTHRLDEVSRHAREHEQLGHGQVDERRDDVVHVTTGAEIASGAVDHDALYIGGVSELTEQVTQLRIRFERQRILALGPLKGDRADSPLHRPSKVLRAIVAEGGAVAGKKRGGVFVHRLSPYLCALAGFTNPCAHANVA